MSDYTYYNLNPNREEREDCVIRAIGLGSGLQYYTVENLLYLIADKCECEMLNVECYRTLLEDIFEYKVFYCNHGETVGDIAKKYNNNIVIIRIQGHLTSSVYGHIFDIWDCSDKIVDRFWVVQN